MSLAEELTIHSREHYCDFDDGEHTIAVFGLGVSALRTAAELEAVSTVAVPEAGTVETPTNQTYPVTVSLS